VSVPAGSAAPAGPAVAVVTGAASGMGRVAAQRLAAAGTEVAALDVDSDGLADTARHSPSMYTFHCDVADSAAVTATVARIESELGPIDRLVHAAGLCRIGAALEHEPSSLRQVLEINYLGTVHACQAVIPGMRRAGAGTVVLFGSLAGWLPSPRLAAYSASKAAVAAYAEVLAQETAGTDITVRCVCPGQVNTPLADAVLAIDPGVLGGRNGAAPEEILDAVERELRDGRGRDNGSVFLFPGGSKLVWLARRFMPGTLRALVSRGVRPVGERSPPR